MIHVTDLALLFRCERYGVLRYQEKEKKIRRSLSEEYHSNLCIDYHPLLNDYLKMNNTPSGKAWDSPERSRELLKISHKARNLRFESDGIRTTIPFLERKEDGSYKATYFFLTGCVREQEIPLMAMNKEIARRNGVDLSEHEIVYLNREYVLEEELEADRLFARSVHVSNRKGSEMVKTIDEMIRELDIDYDEYFMYGKALLEKKPPHPVHTRFCTAPRKCPYYSSCFQEQKLKDNSVEFLFQNSRKEEMEDRKIKSFHQIPPELLDGVPLQYAQYMADKTKSVFMDQAAITNWINELKWPLSYLDFEWDSFSIPPYSRMKPYDVLCFQYSLHIEEENAPLRHSSFFGLKDCRKAFIESLLENIPEKGSILVFNMDGAEKLRLMDLARQFPEYAQRLESVWKRMVDLSSIFQAGCFYDLRQRGHFSLKQLLSLFDSPVLYEDMDVHDGLEAVSAYRKASLSSDETEVDVLATRISEYCSLDTYAEYVILHGLMKKTGWQKKDQKSCEKSAEPLAAQDAESGALEKGKK